MSGLPNGWTSCELAQVVEVLDSQRAPLNSNERNSRIADKPPEKLFPYYGATGQVGFVDNFIFDEPLILLGEDGVPFLDLYKRKAYSIEGKTWVNNHAHVLRPIPSISNKTYIEAFLNSFNYSGYAAGTTRLKLTQGAMNKIPVPLAPLPEQKRIADKLDIVLARVDACRDRLDRLPTLLKRFRQSILAAATSGRLTEDWRETAGSQNSWKPCVIGDLLNGKPRNGYSPKGVDFPTAVKSLTLSATTSGRFKAEHIKYIDEVIPPESHLWLKYGDVLIQRANTLEYVGVSAIFKEKTGQYIYPDLMMKCEANSRVLPDFLHFTLSAETTRTYFRENATGTAGNMPKINQQTVINAPAFLPPIEEQHEIVRRVDTLFAFADRLEARLATARQQVEQLTPALLAKAFRGELVPQDPADEPASRLLQRLAAQRAATPQAKPGRRKAAA